MCDVFDVFKMVFVVCFLGLYNVVFMLSGLVVVCID